MDQPVQPIQPNPTPETPAINPAEAAPQPVAPEVAPAGSAAAPVAVPAPLPVAPAATPQSQTPDQAPAAPAPAASGPQIAEDVDVIEKEWVDKAEQIVKSTVGDPHAEEEAVEDLQIDYMKKRYGKDIKKSVEGQ